MSATDEPIRNLTDLEQHLEDRALASRERDVADCVAHDLPIADVEWEPDGFIVRWTLTGRSDVHDILDDEDDVTAFLTERLRNRVGDGDQFVWTETVRDRVRPALPDRETLIEDDEVIAELVALTKELREDADTRADLRAQAGDLWEWVDDQDREETPADRLPLDDERLDDLIDQALRTAIDELALRRHNVD